MQKFSEDLFRALKKIRLLALGVDGVLSDGGMHFSGHGELYKRFNIQDGLGLVLMPSLGITVMIITGRASDIVARRMEDLKITHVHQGVKHKAQKLREEAGRLGFDLSEVLYMGDDLPDLGVMALSGLSVAPANAHESVRKAATWVTEASGGHGAVREVCDALAHAKDQYDSWIQRFTEQDGL